VAGGAGVSIDGDLPYVDEHAITIASPHDVVWTALLRYVAASLDASRSPLAWLLGTTPRSGFEIAETVDGEGLVLAGRHRFSRYRLVFELHDTATGQTRLNAKTYAAFPGPHGRAYRIVVIGSGAHMLVTTHMLRAVRRRAMRA
jgi:hypothetical protein